MTKPFSVARLIATTLTSTVGLAAVLASSLGHQAESQRVVTPGHAIARMAAVTEMDPAVYERRVKRWINVRREAHGLPPVRFNTCADGVAEKWSKYLADTYTFFHQSLDPFFDRCDATYAGETLARGAVSPRVIVRLWMESDGHRHILLSKYPRKVGIGATTDSHGNWVVAADFVRL